MMKIQTYETMNSKPALIKNLYSNSGNDVEKNKTVDPVIGENSLNSGEIEEKYCTHQS